MPRRMITLNDETDSYLNEFMDEHSIRYPGEALARICKEYKVQKENEWSIGYISEVVTKSIQETFSKEISKIRLAGNSADKNTQIIIELLNGIYFNESYENLITTSDQEVDGVKTARELVENRITHKRQKK